MKKPKKVSVYGKEYKVLYVELPENIDGECSNADAVIRISNRLKGKDLTHTLLHECFHALFYRLSYYQVLSHAIEELLVDTISNFVAENKDLF